MHKYRLPLKQEIGHFCRIIPPLPAGVPTLTKRSGANLPPPCRSNGGGGFLNKWSEFIESIRTSGVIEPIVVTRDFTIVSGHQRVRACNELGITEIPARVKDYADEDAIIKDLLETNVRQRGNIDWSCREGYTLGIKQQEWRNIAKRCLVQ